MAGFSVIDAALEGIRLTREKPRVVLLWGLYYIAFTIVLLIVASVTLGGHTAELLAAMRKPPAEPVALQRLFMRVAPFFLIGTVLGTVFQAMLTAAIYRQILRPDDLQGGLRLGKDELRLLGVFGLLLLVLVAMLFIVVVAEIATAGLPDTAPSLLVANMAVLASWFAGVTVLVRLSLCGAATIARQRLAIIDGWRLTKGRFWRLLATYALAAVLSAVVLFLMNFVLQAIFQVATQVSGMAGGGVGGGPIAIVASLLVEVFLAFAITCFYVILLAPPASAYAALAGETAV